MTEQAPSFDFSAVDRFTTGTVGPKGQRIFYIQAQEGPTVVSLKIEKQQVHALAEYLDTMMDDLPAPEGELPVDLELNDPLIAEWAVGSMGAAYSASQNCVVLWAEQMFVDEDEDVVSPATARFQISLAQAVAFVHRARRVVGDGRPPCRFCGAPVSNDGEWCACSN